MHSAYQHEPKEKAQSRSTGSAFQATVEHPSHTVVHAKLEMTTPDSPEEVEADVAAGDIVQGKVARSSFAGGTGGGTAVSAQMESQLGTLQGKGQQMPQGLRSMMERGFGRDFSQVRLHTDSTAADMSASIHARAFTHGSDIYFNRGQYNPNTTEGQRLVAHELAHVAQGGGKVARDSDPRAENMIVDHYFYNSWTWTAFYMFLANNYPSVVKDMGLEKERTFLGFYNDLDWEDDYGKEFLKDVVVKIVSIEEKKQKGSLNTRYKWALNAVQILFNNPPSSQLVAPFASMAKIAANLQKTFDDNSEYFHKLQTSSLNEAKKYHKEGDPLKGVSFDGNSFDNRSSIQENVFKVTYMLNKNIATKYFDDVDDVEDHGFEFRKQIKDFTSEWVDFEYEKDMKKSSEGRTKGSMIHTFNRLKEELLGYCQNVSDKGQKDVILMIYMLVDSRHKNLYNPHIDTSKLIPAKVWTDIFMTTMKIELSLFLGSAAFGDFVAGIVGKAITNEVAAQLVTDITTGVIKDSAIYFVDTLNSPPEKLKEMTGGDVFKDLGLIFLQNAVTSTVNIGLKSLAAPTAIEQNRLDEIEELMIDPSSLGKEDLKLLKSIELRGKFNDIYVNFTDKIIEKGFNALKGESATFSKDDLLKFGLTSVVSFVDEDAGAIVTAFTDNL